MEAKKVPYTQYDWAKQYPEEVLWHTKKICSHETGCQNKKNYSGAPHYWYYQFSKATYNNVAKKYCGVENPTWDDETQHKVAVCYVNAIYKKFGNLDDASCVWYSGKSCDTVKQEWWYHTQQKWGKDAYPSVYKYVSSVSQQNI